MTVTIDQFRQDFPAFSDSAKWTDDAISMYLTLANTVLDPLRWMDFLTLGTELYVAHNLVLDEQSNVTAARGGIPGTTSGVVSSKGVGPASVSYDAGAGAEVDGGQWNLTIFGRRFLRLVRMVGMGPTYIGAGPISNRW